MKSRVAESVRREQQKRVLAMSPGERVELALRLGRESIEIFAAANDVTLTEAKKILEENRHKGRRRSKCNSR